MRNRPPTHTLCACAVLLATPLPARAGVLDAAKDFVKETMKDAVTKVKGRSEEERREKIAAELKAQEDEKRAKYKEKIEKAKAKARAKAAAKAGKAEL